MTITRVLLASRSKPALQALQACLQGVGGFECRTRLMTNGSADPLSGLDWAPEIVVLRFDGEHLEEITAWAATDAAARPALIVVAPAGQPEIIRLALRSGAKDFLTEPTTKSELLSALQRLQQELRQRPAGRGGGTVSVFVGAAGGAGTSFLATNVAHVLSSVGKRSTALVDMDLNFGPLAHHLDLRPERGLLEALDVVASLDEHALAGYGARHRSGLRLFGAIPGPVVLSKDVSTAALTAFLNVLTVHNRHVVVDVPHAIDTLNALVFGLANQVFVVLQQSVLHVRNAVRLSRILTDELGVGRDRIRVVVNRSAKDATVELDDIRRSLDIPSMFSVPSHYRSALESIDTGVPLYETDPNAPVSKALLTLYRDVIGEPDAGRGSFLRRSLPSFLRK
jgi:pilus assembly protein CpaE